MDKKITVTVYCSSRYDLDEEYENTAVVAGETIAKCGAQLLYGGVDAGMMHTVAQTAADNGAHVIGVIPEVFRHRADKAVTELVCCHDLNDRKGIMIERGDLFVVLPGGIGTLDEWLSTLAFLKVAADKKRKIIVANINGMYDKQWQQICETAESPFARCNDIIESNIIVCDEAELRQAIETEISKL